jgi:hypothetical protein
MKQNRGFLFLSVLALIQFLSACGIMDEGKSKPPSLGLIATPPSYYSTPKARYLGEKYKVNLDRLVDRVVRNPKTSNLQFANNIASVGGIGFFTHSAATTPDARYLEIILATPETFETGGDYSEKLSRVFSSYGNELLSILASDPEIYNEKEVSGYGVNFSWRKVARPSETPRVGMERAVAYFDKQKVRSFLRREISENELLKNAVIFAVDEDGPMNLVSFRPPELKADFRPPIQEETLPPATAEIKPQEQQMTDSGKSDLQVSSAHRASVEPNQRMDAPQTSAKSQAMGAAAESSETESPAVRPKEVALERQESRPAVQSPEQEVPSEPELDSPVHADQRKQKEPPSGALAKQQMPGKDSGPGKVVTARSENSAAQKSDVTAPDATQIRAVEAVPDLPAVVGTNRPPEPETVSDQKARAETPAAAKASDEKPEPRRPEESAINAPAEGPAKPQVSAAPRPIEAQTEIASANSSRSDNLTESPRAADQQERAQTEAKLLESAKPEVPKSAVESSDKTKSSAALTSDSSLPSAPVIAATEAAQSDAMSKSSTSGLSKGENARVSEQGKLLSKPARTPAAETALAARRDAVPALETENKPKAPEVSAVWSVGPESIKSESPTPLPFKREPASSRATIEPPAASNRTVSAVSQAAQRIPQSGTENRSQTKADLSKPSGAGARAEQQPTAPVTVIARSEIKTGTDELERPSVQPSKALESDRTGQSPSLNVENEKGNSAVPASSPLTSPEPPRKIQTEVAERQTAEQTARALPYNPPAGASSSAAAKAETQTAEANFQPSRRSSPADPAASEKSAPEQIALLTKKPAETALEKPPVRPPLKALEGYIIQLTFSDRAEAQRWAEKLNGRGFAVSTTETGTGSFRVRMGNFPMRGDAERQLRVLNQDGLKGIVLNLPQAYRPEVHSSADEGNHPVATVP